jgi:hypothetical protein
MKATGPCLFLFPLNHRVQSIDAQRDGLVFVVYFVIESLLSAIPENDPVESDLCMYEGAN